MHVVVIGGAEIKRICGTVCDYVGTCAELNRKESYHNEVAFYQKEDNNFVFANPSFLQHVIDSVDLSNKTLITHNSDATLTSYSNGTATFRYITGYEWVVNNLHPKFWFSQNSLVTNAIPLPLGPGEEPFDVPVPLNPLTNKSILVYKNFNNKSNPIERDKCDRFVNVPNDILNNRSRKEFYNLLSSSYFVVSPDGFGIDCHRHWEALYYNCIPIVTRNKLTEFYSTLFPMCLIDDWSSFDMNDYTPELYTQKIANFDRMLLTLEYYIKQCTNLK